MRRDTIISLIATTIISLVATVSLSAAFVAFSTTKTSGPLELSASIERPATFQERWDALDDKTF